MGRGSGVKGGRRDDLDGLFVRSSWEANVARYLKFLVRHGSISSWSYEAEEFEFPVKRGTRFYKPDFRVVNLNLSVEYWEVKGWWDKVSKTQMKRMAKYYKDVKIVLIDEDAYRAIASKAKHLCPHWESG